MALRIVSTRPDPAIVSLPWHLPLGDWDNEHVVPLPRGISRHVVRIVRIRSDFYAVKETRPAMAFGEYRMLRDLQRLGLPTVQAAAVVDGRTAEDGTEIEPCLVTQHLSYSLPYRSLFSHGLRADSVPKLIDALAVLLVRLHLAGFFWGDVSLSNVLFRRSAGEFEAYLVDAETGELHPTLSEGQRRHDLQVAYENLFGELLDLQAGGLLDDRLDPFETVDRIQQRYDTLWVELTESEEFDTDEMWRIEQRVARLNELGFDVAELDIVTDWPRSRVQLQPKVVEAGHHSRELQRLTGLDVEENQARRLLNDIAAYTAHFQVGRDNPMLVAHRWLNDIYEPIVSMVPDGLRGRLEPPEMFHEILEHRWYLSEKAGKEVDIFETAGSYLDDELSQRPNEALSGPEDPDALLPAATS